MPHVVSVSLGSSRRDKRDEVEILGLPFTIERQGTDGDTRRFAAKFAALDGRVDALGIGGADLYLVVGSRRYVVRDVARWTAGARTTPVVDGSGLKHTLEREAILRLQADGTVDFASARVLLMSAVDRYGMAQALSEVCPRVVYGDLMFSLGLPFAIRRYATVERLGRLLLPLVTRLPFAWFYPTGRRQDVPRPRFGRAFAEADVIAGDSLYILRYMPERLEGKTVVTQSVRRSDLDRLRAAGVRRVIATTPVIGGETFATNVMEAVLVSALGKRPEHTTAADYLGLLSRLGWSPTVVDLAG